jgi:superfamily II DNA or RNA helicase
MQAKQLAQVQKENVSTYLGAKGYTIYKECLDIKEQRVIRDELNVRPYIPKSPIQQPAYPVFRESANKFYLPRYYGIKNYGDPEEMLIPPGDDIQLAFQGDLRDYQLHIVDVYKREAANIGGGLLEIPCGRGKTVIALKIISEMKKKTLVIVHKGFLLNQWIERIEQFLPSAKVGRIQGQILDIEGKDIVIGMLQSLSMKEYPDTMFHSFGLIIVDECHHISSEVFCRSLQKIITRYTLGLSATMNRKDGLTKVFKMFLGEIVYSEERESTDQVLVKAIQYQVDAPEFNAMCYDYRGSPAYSTMISKLCEYRPRSDFILQVLEKELAIGKETQLAMQVMILAHNKNVLTYLHDAIKKRGLYTVGYYVGGMKEPALKQTETCQVIIATYSMAAEALDIKTLTTLILATPKTDIVQAVGRILRVKHERPLVIDIIDSHDVFLSQWQKRRKYYTSNNYKIMHTTSDLYALDKWTTLGEKKVKKEKGSAKALAKAPTLADTKKPAAADKKGPAAALDTKGLNGSNLLTKGVSAAAQLINMCNADASESTNENSTESDEESDEDEETDEDTSEADNILFGGSSKNKLLKGRCFI